MSWLRLGEWWVHEGCSREPCASLHLTRLSVISLFTGKAGKLERLAQTLTPLGVTPLPPPASKDVHELSCSCPWG